MCFEVWRQARPSYRAGWRDRSCEERYWRPSSFCLRLKTLWTVKTLEKDGDIIGTRCVRGRPTKVQLDDKSSPTDILNETKQMIVKSRGPCPDLQNKLRRDSPNMPLIVAPPSLFTDGVTTPKGCHSCPNFVLSLCYSCPNLAQLLLIQCLVRCRGINVLDFYAIQPPLPITRHKMVRFTAIHPICSLLKQTDDGGYLLPNQ